MLTVARSPARVDHRSRRSLRSTRRAVVRAADWVSQHVCGPSAGSSTNACSLPWRATALSVRPCVRAPARLRLRRTLALHCQTISSPYTRADLPVARSAWKRAVLDVGTRSGLPGGVCSPSGRRGRLGRAHSRARRAGPPQSCGGRLRRRQSLGAGRSAFRTRALHAIAVAADVAGVPCPLTTSSSPAPVSSCRSTRASSPSPKPLRACDRFLSPEVLCPLVPVCRSLTGYRPGMRGRQPRILLSVPVRHARHPSASPCDALLERGSIGCSRRGGSAARNRRSCPSRPPAPGLLDRARIGVDLDRQRDIVFYAATRAASPRHGTRIRGSPTTAVS